jgi:hypothetical protein
VADGPRVTPRQVALADQLQARIAEDIREFSAAPADFEEQFERTKAILDQYDELPVGALAAAIVRATKREVERAVIHDSRIETEGDHG